MLNLYEGQSDTKVKEKHRESERDKDREKGPFLHYYIVCIMIVILNKINRIIYRH